MERSTYHATPRRSSSARRHTSHMPGAYDRRRLPRETGGLPAPRPQGSTARSTRGTTRGAHSPARPESDASRLGAAFRGALFAIPFSALAGLIFLLIAAGVAHAMPDPDGLITPLGLSALGLSMLCGGLITSRRARRAPLLCGLLFGGLAVVALFAGSLVFSDASRQTLSLGLSAGVRAGLYATLVAVSTLGAWIGKKR